MEALTEWRLGSYPLAEELHPSGINKDTGQGVGKDNIVLASRLLFVSKQCLICIEHRHMRIGTGGFLVTIGCVFEGGGNTWTLLFQS